MKPRAVPAIAPMPPLKNGASSLRLRNAPKVKSDRSAFWKGFFYGWVGMAAIVVFLLWGMTPRGVNGGTEFGFVPDYGAGYEYRVC